eukprot:SAG31_NODE_984_length_10552_cov_4.679231_7_plen_61_part_00
MSQREEMLYESLRSDPRSLCVCLCMCVCLCVRSTVAKLCVLFDAQVCRSLRRASHSDLGG